MVGKVNKTVIFGNGNRGNVLIESRVLGVFICEFECESISIDSKKEEIKA